MNYPEYIMIKHNRRSIRLNHYDYSQPGSYFVTICTHAKSPLFGEIINGEMVLNDLGKIVEQCMSEILIHYPDVELDKWVIMPNHVHMIIVIYPNENDKPFVGAQNFVNVGASRFFGIAPTVV